MKSTLDQAVDRFLCWELPRDFNPDCGISFMRETDYAKTPDGEYSFNYVFKPTGTNLLDAQQAKAMLEHVTQPMLIAHAQTVDQLVKWEKHIDELNTTIAAQRKVLEQALGALKNVTEYMSNGDPMTTQDAVTDKAITAIQEQLK